MVDMVDMLNRAGDGFCGFAAAMLVQSGALIALLYLIDLVIRKHVRAVVRYGIWMLVFVKLVLPVSLSSPVGVGQLVGERLSVGKTETRAVESDSEQGAVTVEVPAGAAIPRAVDAAGNNARSAEWRREFTEVQVTPVQDAAVKFPEPAALKWQGVVFLGWVVGVLVLAVLLLQRYLFVRGLIAQSEAAAGRLAETLRACCEEVGVRGEAELRLCKNMLSPAACGLLRPVILMPGSLLEGLSKEKLRAVLVHELAHIKRGDLWVNFAQTVLQIVYFYNPLLWFANGVVRRVREKAVDEMVLTKLGGEAKRYSDILIDVAETAFSRPHFSLRLVGVVESKKALAGRIRHILGRPLPKSAKVGLAGLAAIVICGAVLLPMAKGESRPPTFVVRGTVTDSQTGEAVSGARVGDDGYAGGKQFAITDSNGYYKYETWYEEHGLKAEAEGYESQAKGFATKLFGSEKERVIDFELTPQPGQVSGKAGQYTACLSNGVTVEIVGVCEYPSEGKEWWRPDGSRLGYRIVTEERSGYTDKKKAYEIAYRVEAPNDVSVGWPRIKGSSPQSGLVVVEPEGVKAVRAHISVWGDSTTVEIPIAAGEWKTLGSSSGGGQVTAPVGKRKLMFSPAVGTKEKLVITVTDDLGEFEDYRLVAVDKQGGVHAGERMWFSQDNIRQNTFTFVNLDPESVERFEFQRRSYEWVTFKKVSLKPGFETDVEVEVANNMAAARLAAVREKFEEGMELGLQDLGDLPDFKWEDIPALLQLAEVGEVIEKVPVLPVSSYMPRKCIKGMVALWYVEGVRHREEYFAVAGDVNEPRLIERFLPLVPICYRVGDEYEAEAEASVEIFKEVLEAYKQWWEKAGGLAPSEGALIDPLEDTDIVWPGGSRLTGAPVRWSQAIDGLRCRWVKPGGPLRIGDEVVLAVEVENNSEEAVFWPCSSQITVVVGESVSGGGTCPKFRVEMGEGARLCTSAEVHDRFGIRAGEPVEGFYRFEPGGTLRLIFDELWKLDETGWHRRECLVERGPLSRSVFVRNWMKCSPLILNVEEEGERGIIAYWDFDGDAKDGVGGNDGTVYGAALTEGVSGQGYYFEGDGDCISIPDSKVFEFGDGDFSVSLWFKSGYPINNFLMNFRQNDNNPHIELYVNESLGTHLLPGFARMEYPYAGVRDDKWHHAAVTLANGVKEGYKLYLDGMEVCKATYVGKLQYWDTITIGGRNKESKDGFKGAIDEVSVYSRALSAAEVRRLYEKFGDRGEAERQSSNGRKGLICYWDFEGNAVDKVGGIQGETSGAALVDDGVSGKCYYFEGDGDCISIPDSAVFNFDGDDFTISAWFRTNVCKAPFPFIVNFRQNDNNPHIELYASGDVGSHLAPGDTRLTYTEAGVDDDKWHHAAITLDNGAEDGYRLYLDGSRVAKATYTGRLKDWDTITIGAQRKGGNEHALEGFIDEVGVYNRALSGSEIRDVYREFRPAESAEDEDDGAKGPEIAEGLIAHWDFEEGAGEVVYDSVGEHDGTVYGAEWVPGRIGRALSFSGEGYVEVPYSDDLNVTEQVTVAAWVRAARRQPTYDARIVCKCVYPDSGYNLHITGSTRARFEFEDIDSVLHQADSTSAVNDGVWHHITGSYDGQYVRVYVDGVLESSVKAEGYKIKPNERPLRIGQTTRPVENQIFKGVIDEVRIYGRALSNGEVAQLYQSTMNLHKEPLKNSGPVAYWSFDEVEGKTAYDSAGDNDGTIHAAKRVGGIIGGALSFSGVGYVEVPDSDFLDLSEQMTISAWVKAAATQPTDHARIVCKLVHPISGYTLNIANNNILRFGFHDMDSVGHGVGSVSTVNDETWHYIAGTFDGKALRLYVDGRLVSSADAEGYRIRPNDRPLRIGQTPNPTENQIFRGVIDEVRIYNRALSSAEIGRLYSQVRQRPASSGEPVAHWKFDEGEGKTAYDSAGNNNASIHGTEWAAGISGGALSFDGAYDYVNCGGDSSLDLDVFTWSLWIKRAEMWHSDERALISTNGRGGHINGTYGLQIDTGGNFQNKVQFGRHGDGYLPTLWSQSSIGDTDWHHIAATRNSDGEAVIYVDGIANGTGKIGSRTAFNEVVIGAGVEQYGNFKGLIDEVRIYARALSESEIRDIYKESRPAGTAGAEGDEKKRSVGPALRVFDGVTREGVYDDGKERSGGGGATVAARASYDKGSDALPAWPVKLISAEKKDDESSYRWKISRNAAGRFHLGWFKSYHRDNLGHKGTMSSAISDTTIDLKLDIRKESGWFRVIQQYREGDKGEWVRSEDRIELAEGCILRESYVSGEISVTNARNQTLWSGDVIHVRENGTERKFTLSFIIRVLRDGDVEDTFKPPFESLPIPSEYPFFIEGRVTDEEGKPVYGASVRVATGVGTLVGGSETVTDDEGCYRLRFGPGWNTPINETNPLGVGVQAASVWVDKDGLYEKSLCRQGNLLMAENAKQAKERAGRDNSAGVVLPNKPFKLDFVMAAAAKIRGKVADRDGKPVPEHELWVGGSELYPARSVLASIVTDARGGIYGEQCSVKKILV